MFLTGCVCGGISDSVQVIKLRVTADAPIQTYQFTLFEQHKMSGQAKMEILVEAVDEVSGISEPRWFSAIQTRR